VKIQLFIAFGLAVVLTASAQTSRQSEAVKSRKTPKAQNGEADPWGDPIKKSGSVKAVLEYVFANPQEGEKCVGKGTDEACAQADNNTKNLFKDHGNNMEIPSDSRAIIFDRGEQALGAGRSVIIAVPPPDTNMNDNNKLLTYVLNYVHWAPDSSALAVRGVPKVIPTGLPPWYCPDKKRIAILNVLKYMVQHQTQANALVGKDSDAREFFQTHGQMAVPIEYGARVIVFHTEELGKKYKGHVWLELPPKPFYYWGNWPDGTDNSTEPDCNPCG